MKNQADNLKNQIKQAEKELAELQAACLHNDQKLKMDDEGNIRWTCEECGAQLAYPSPEEIKKFLS